MVPQANGCSLAFRGLERQNAVATGSSCCEICCVLVSLTAAVAVMTFSKGQLQGRGDQLESLVLSPLERIQASKVPLSCAGSSNSDHSKAFQKIIKSRSSDVRIPQVRVNSLGVALGAFYFASDCTTVHVSNDLVLQCSSCPS